jgi:hypothetical protein
MRQGDHHGIAQAPMSGHDRPKGTVPPAQAPVGPTPRPTYGLDPRLQLCPSAVRRAQGPGQQHRGVTEPTHPNQPRMVVTYRREDPCYGPKAVAAAGRVEGSLPLGGIQPRLVAVSLKLAWGGPHERYLVPCIFTAF